MMNKQGTDESCKALAIPEKTNRFMILFYSLILLLLPDKSKYFSRLFRIKKKQRE